MMEDKILVDRSDMKGVLERFPAMIREAVELGKGFNITGEIRRIVVTGMGGSAISGDILRSLMKDSEIHVSVNKGYTLPRFVDANTLVIAISYSGNTEETVSAYRDALRRKATVVSISSGGKLEELARMNETTHIKVPKGIQPRLSTPYLLLPMLNVLAASGLIDNQADSLVQMSKTIGIQQIKERAQDIAVKLKGKVPLIYSSDDLLCVAEKWKTDINENAKVPAFYNLFPEFNHNEICSFLNLVGEYFVVMIKDEGDHERVKKRISIVKKLIMKQGVDVIELSLTGETLLVRIMSSIYQGMWISYYLALEYGVDPTDVSIIEDLKKELER